MPYTSCIPHVDDPFVIVRRGYVRMFCGDTCAAAIIAEFEYQTNLELDRIRKTGKDGIPWVQISLPEIESRLLGMYSKRSIQDRLKALDEAGVLKSADSSGRVVKSYLLNVQLVKESLSDRREIPLVLLTGNSASQNLTGNSASQNSVDWQNCHQIASQGKFQPNEINDIEGCPGDKIDIEEEHIEQEQTNPIPLRKTPPRPISELLDTTNLEDYNPVGHPGRRVSKLTRDWKDPGRVERREFRRQQREALKTARTEAQEPAIQSETRSPSRTSPPPTSAPGQNPPPSNIGLPEEAEIWNEIVKHGEPVRLFSWDMPEGRNLSRCRNNREFTMDRWRDACRHIEDVLSDGINKYNQGISIFARIIEKDDKWWRAVNHGYSHLKNRPQDPPPGQRPKADFKKAIEMLERGEI